MTIEEKAKAYDEIVNKLRRFMAQGVDPLITRADVQDFFPELAESGDEKVRKLLIEAVTQVLQDQYCSNRGVSKEKVVAWLEKQGQPRMQYGITINGVKYEFVEDHEGDECERCALKELCKSQEEGEVLCIYLFTESVATNHRFKKR